MPCHSAVHVHVMVSCKGLGSMGALYLQFPPHRRLTEAQHLSGEASSYQALTRLLYMIYQAVNRLLQGCYREVVEVG